MAWNIEGLKTKLLRYDIAELIKQYDLMSLQETWDVETDYCKINFSYYTLYTCPAKRSLRGGRHMGGVLVLVKNVYPSTFHKYTKGLTWV